MATSPKSKSQRPVRISLENLYGSMNQTCLVMIDRSMWFAKAFEALGVADFSALVDRHPQLRGSQREFREPVVYAFSYAQRVFLCSAMELCLLHHHLNSVALLIQRAPERIPLLVNLLKILKKKHSIKSLKDWIDLDGEIRFQHLRELSFSNLEAASRLFDDIYGPGCFDNAWGTEMHSQLASKYREYQTLRNGIVHRGDEVNSGIKIEASESEMERTFEDSKAFRDAILSLSNWCCAWWINIQRRATIH